MSEEQKPAPVIPGLSGVPAKPAPSKAEQLAKISAQTGMAPEVIDMVKQTVAPNLTWTELEAGLYMCAKRKLDPMQKQVSFIKFGGRMTLHVTIDGLRTLAARSKAYLGSTVSFIYLVDGKTVEADYPPTADAELFGARAIVKKKLDNMVGEFTAVALASEYLKDSKNTQNKQMPHIMLAKDAEALALRKAFPEDLSGMYEPAEFATAGENPVDKVIDIS